MRAHLSSQYQRETVPETAGADVAGTGFGAGTAGQDWFPVARPVRRLNDPGQFAELPRELRRHGCVERNAPAKRLRVLASDAVQRRLGRRDQERLEDGETAAVAGAEQDELLLRTWEAPPLVGRDAGRQLVDCPGAGRHGASPASK